MEAAAPYSPVLPADDPHPGQRRAAIERGRVDYQFAQVYGDDDGFRGLSVSARVPPRDDSDLRFLLKTIRVDLRLIFNQHIAGKGAGLELPAASGPAATLTDVLGVARVVGDRNVMFNQPIKAVSRIERSFPENLRGYNGLYARIPKPDIIDRLASGRDRQDEIFAWQRLAGSNPMVLQGIHTIPTPEEAEAQTDALRTAMNRLPKKHWELLAGLLPNEFMPPERTVLPGWFGVTNDHFRSVMGADDSLERAAAERRLYLADYRDVAGLPQGEWKTGELGVSRPKLIYPALALFAWQPPSGPAGSASGSFRAVAIQCDQIGDDLTVFTPSDGVPWEMACMVVQCADANVHEMIYHLGRTHMVMEAVVVACRRSMSPNHPLRILLEPHFVGTLFVNDYATKNLIAPGGQVDQLFASTMAGTLELLGRGAKQLQFRNATPDRDVAHRSVDDRAGLPDYPWRDDAQLVYALTAEWARSYVALYYPTDDAVGDDLELQTFVHAMSDPTEGGLDGVDPVTDRATLGWFIGAIVWTASSGHSALNYSQFPFMGYARNSTGALYAEAPTRNTADIEDCLLEMMPPLHQALLQFNILYQLSNVQSSVLGKYPRGYFIDRRVGPILRRYRRQLSLADRTIVRRDTTRVMPYPYLRPSKTGQSVFI
ncbi:MAG TPA: lipoxygenase family protein [Ilumatobacteraceae bacterium]|nr:lipoxygenase family protein [Ilumatobacteraceae bacterium]